MKTANSIAAALRTKVDDIAFALCLAAFGVALFALSGSTAAGGPESVKPAPATASRQQPFGELAGTFVNGMPVYRLPSISVSVSRKAEMARIEQEEPRAQAAAAARRMPVYRLPVISVSASRKAEMARIEQEQPRAQAAAAARRSGTWPERTVVAARDAGD